MFYYVPKISSYLIKYRSQELSILLVFEMQKEFSMLTKHKIITSILDVGVVAIVRAEKSEQAAQIVEACLAGGLNAVEITFTVDRADLILEQLSKQNTSCILGAGTVLDAETARIAILSGASYIVSPSFDKATSLLCNRYAVPYMPGSYTPKEIVEALSYGVDIIKLFPGSLLSPSAIKAFLAPLPQANIMPTGGVNLDNAAEWINAGAVALGVGGDLMGGAKTGEYKKITEKAEAYRKTVSQARAQQQTGVGS